MVSPSTGLPRSQFVSANWPLEVFSKHLVQRRSVEHDSASSFQRAVLVLEGLQFTGVGDLHPAYRDRHL
jgi:hypothetical protein